MKKLFCILFFSILIVYAQAQLSYGPKLALNLPTQSWSGPGSEKYTTGFIGGVQIGGFAQYRINEKFSGQAEFIYSMDGTRQTNNVVSKKGNLRGNYIRIPVLGQYHIGEHIHIQTGPSLGFLLSASQKWEGETYKSKIGSAKTDFGWNFGGGYNLSTILEGLSTDIRFYLGFTNTTTVGRNGGNNFKNRSIALGFQYAIPKK